VTEQSKIPLPPDGHNAGRSLLERADGAFGLSAFKPAPVPAEMVAPQARRPAQPAVEPEPVAPKAPGVQPGPVLAPADTPVIAFEQAEAQPETVREAPLTGFSGPRHRISREHLHAQGLIVPEGQVTALLEEFRIVKRQLLRAARDAQQGGAPSLAQLVLVCSPLPGEGKTFCAANLALAIAAEKDSEVLLVDADFAKPSILSVLGLPGGPGLMDALADPTIRVEECVMGTDIPGLWVLPAGNQTTQDSEYLASSRTAEVLARLTKGAPNRMVIFDSPPALAASPAAELAKYVGQALLVVRADTTGQSSIEDALTLLSTCPDIKLLLNAALFSPSGRRFGAYYGYGGQGD
jgi:exopolysaccharide/PEP-CTERM locus tyrosine autokinase